MAQVPSVNKDIFINRTLQGLEVLSQKPVKGQTIFFLEGGWRAKLTSHYAISKRTSELGSHHHNPLF